MPDQSSAPRAHSRPDLSDESDPDLLAIAGMRNDDLSEESQSFVEEAFAELYRRHREPLLRLLRNSGEGRAYQAARGGNALRSAVGKTFLKACARADTYDEEKASVRTWLVSIARNHVKDALDEEYRQTGEREQTDIQGEDLERAAARASEVTLSEIGNTADPDPELISVIRDAFEEVLTERQWELLLPYLAIQSEGESDGRADKGAAEKLADRLGTSRNNLRANKSRCLKRIEEYVRERLPGRFSG